MPYVSPSMADEVGLTFRMRNGQAPVLGLQDMQLYAAMGLYGNAEESIQLAGRGRVWTELSVCSTG